MANASGKYIELYAVASAQVKNPSKWVTEIYIPIGQSIVTETEAIPEIPAEVSNVQTKPKTEVKPKTEAKPIAKPAQKPAPKKPETKDSDEFDF